ncbi:hypothetical protein Q7C_2368 [Methylophaga frappieri]|uniref:Uncharacterized protein n=1 Tax=Methylophaga frappieri (strain ATCC BAA-2434 / DSM 25690 / JAM7) TaxID=754477 RepID=I1YKQ9_METFJ|nr:hypothetical protein Q7C_2368 [Methylophaga frappieri]
MNNHCEDAGSDAGLSLNRQISNNRENTVMAGIITGYHATDKKTGHRRS